ncbi:MAG: signal peptidase II [Patescibacteria group bacterium]
MSKIITSYNIKKIAWLIAGAIFFILDRYLKNLAITTDKSHNILGDILTFNFIPNYNIAFSLPLRGPWLTIVISLIIISIIIYLLFSKLKKIEKISFFFILLGAISNLLDRLQYGYVIDYFDLKWFTIFNLADVLITFGTIVLILSLFKKSHV